MMTFEQIYKNYNRTVFLHIKRIVKNELDAEELSSEAMIRIHKNLATYREDLAKLSTWIITIAKNVAIDFVRKRRLETIALEDTVLDWAHGDDDAQIDNLIALKCSESNPEEIMITAEIETVMMKRFNQLNESDRQIATLHYFEGLSYDEVSAELNMPLGTVKAKLHRARTAMMGNTVRQQRNVTIL